MAWKIELGAIAGDGQMREHHIDPQPLAARVDCWHHGIR
jgi:hypothetical protein